MIEAYHLWYMREVVPGVPPVIDGAQGKAMNWVIAHLRLVVTERYKREHPDGILGESHKEERVLAAWQYILQCISGGVVSQFYSSQVKVNQIYSNLNNIMKQIKDNNGQRDTGGKKQPNYDHLKG